VGANEPAALLAKLTERSVLLQMIRQVVAPAIKPKARSYFGIDAEAYGHASHIDMSALKVLPRALVCADGARAAEDVYVRCLSRTFPLRLVLNRTIPHVSRFPQHTRSTRAHESSTISTMDGMFRHRVAAERVPRSPCVDKRAIVYVYGNKLNVAHDTVYELQAKYTLRFVHHLYQQ
jgi:hypothetical protein